jgi:hypothetical protein
VQQSIAAQESDDCTQPTQAQAPTQTGRNDEVSTSTFLGIGHLITQDSCEAFVRHAAPPQDPLTLHQQRCGNNENIIASAFTTTLEEKWDIEHDNQLLPRAGKSEKSLFARFDHRVNDSLEPQESLRISKNVLPEKRAINPAYRGANAWK